MRALTRPCSSHPNRRLRPTREKNFTIGAPRYVDSCQRRVRRVSDRARLNSACRSALRQEWQKTLRLAQSQQRAARLLRLTNLTAAGPGKTPPGQRPQSSINRIRLLDEDPGLGRALCEEDFQQVCRYAVAEVATLRQGVRDPAEIGGPDPLRLLVSMGC